MTTLGARGCFCVRLFLVSRRRKWPPCPPRPIPSRLPPPRHHALLPARRVYRARRVGRRLGDNPLGRGSIGHSLAASSGAPGRRVLPRRTPRSIRWTRAVARDSDEEGLLHQNSNHGRSSWRSSAVSRSPRAGPLTWDPLPRFCARAPSGGTHLRSDRANRLETGGGRAPRRALAVYLGCSLFGTVRTSPRASRSSRAPLDTTR